jgi:hypothetical protein
VAGPASAAQSAGAFDVVVPTGLPEGWRATSARFTPGPVEGTGTWFNGYIDPNGEFVAVVQQDFDVEGFIVDQTDGGDLEGTVDLDSGLWQMFYSTETSERAMVLTDPEVTTVVTGTVPFAELEAFAGLLRPVA